MPPHSNKKKKKIIKSDTNELIENTLEESKTEPEKTIHNEFSLFNINNIDLIYNSKFDEEGETLDKNKEKGKKDKFNINNNNYNYLFKCISFPNECHSMPLLILNTNKNIISSQCPANGLSNELTNPHEPNEITETPINEYLKKISEFYNSIKCSSCSKIYYPNNNNLNDAQGEKNIEIKYFLCYSCNKYFCNKCKEQHDKQINNNENELLEKHYILNVEHLSCYCLYHYEKNFAYCNNCKQNICVKCTNEKRHNSHDIVLFKNILINNKEVNEIKQKINNEKKNLYYFESNKWCRNIKFRNSKNSNGM